jgi:DNA-binding transcriptional regulator YbjK
MRKTLIIMAAVAVALAIFGCQKRAEEATAETAETTGQALLTVDEAKGRLKVILEDVDALRTSAQGQEPSAELVQNFKDNVARLEALNAELMEVKAPEAEAAAYAEARANVETAIEGVNALVRLTEIALNKDTEMAAEEVAAINDTARTDFVKACEYAAPDIAAKLKEPAKKPSE